jgi:outer membrane PBP1 activator LpoA protein
MRLKQPATIVVALSALLPHFVAAQGANPDTPFGPSPRTVAQAVPETPRALRVVLLLPLESAMLKRAAVTVRDGASAVFASRKGEAAISECSYGADNSASVAAAYERCVDANVDWVIGPLGRSDVTALALAKLPMLRPTLMLSPLGTTPPTPLAVLSPDLESEAEAIAQQATEDACRKPLLAEASGPLASRVAVAISSFWRERVATPLQQVSLGSRDSWRRAADGWRRDNIDCVLFAGGGAVLSELRPYLRGMVIYGTSASYEAALERTADWTGVRIADAPWLVDTERQEFAPFTPAEPLSPTLARLYALGIDAARLVLAAGRSELPGSFAGAIGQLTLRDAQYRRQPMIGEFRERALVKVGP